MAKAQNGNFIAPRLPNPPPADTRRWSPQRKASVVEAVCQGLVSLDDACRRYQMTVEEFSAWQSAIKAHGIGALRVTRLQYYRGRGKVERPA